MGEPQPRSRGDDIDPALVRETPDPARSATDTSTAMRVLGRSRPAIIEGIKRRSIPGYAIRKESNAKWYVYEDFLYPHAQAPPVGVDELARLRARLTAIEGELTSERARTEARREGRRKVNEAAALIAAANQLLVEAYKSFDDVTDLESSDRTGQWLPDTMGGEV